MGTVDQVVAAILEGLYAGQFTPGQKLTEADLTRRFGVARVSVREAKTRLAAEGLLTLSLHRGASIRVLSRQDVADSLEVIEALASLAARLAAERISRPEDKRALKETLALLAKTASSNNTFEFGRARDRFYRLLANISGNRELMRLITTVQSHLIRVQFRAAYVAKDEQRGLENYRQIMAAIANRDAVAAEQAMRRHIHGTAAAISQLPDRYFRA